MRRGTRTLSLYGPSLVVLATALLLLLVGPHLVWQLTYARSQARVRLASEWLESNQILQQLNQAYRDLSTLVEPSVVHISAERRVRDGWGNVGTVGSSGSGWIYDEQGHIVTNLHVIEDAQRIEVQLHTGERRSAEPVGRDQFTDIAVIKIPVGRLQPALRADPNDPDDRVEQGDLVFAFGSPFDFRFSMSSGVVSGKGRSVGVIRDDLGREGYENFIQVDAAINPGNSGGPLTDARGRVIGMNTAIATGRRSAYDEGQFAGIGLAIPLRMIEPVVQQLIENRVVQKGFLGVRVGELTPQVTQELQGEGFIGQGVLVTHVYEPGLDRPAPAKEAGVELGDVITHVNGEPVGSVQQLRSLISSMLPGEIARLRIWRHKPEKDPRTLTIEVTLSRLDTLRVAGVVPSDQRRDRIEFFGIGKMSTATPQLAEHYGIPFRPGIIIEEVIADSQIDGIVPPGTLIVAVMDMPVSNVEALFERLSQRDLVRGARMTFLLPDGTLMKRVLSVR